MPALNVLSTNSRVNDILEGLREAKIDHDHSIINLSNGPVLSLRFSDSGEMKRTENWLHEHDYPIEGLCRLPSSQWIKVLLD